MNTKPSPIHYTDEEKIKRLSAWRGADMKEIAKLKAELAEARDALNKIETKCLSKDNMKRTIRSIYAIAFNYLNKYAGK